MNLSVGNSFFIIGNIITLDIEEIQKRKSLLEVTLWKK